MVPNAWLEDCATAGAGNARDARGGHEASPRLVDVSRNQKPEAPFRRASRSRLSPTDARRFPGNDTFAAVARAVCSADVLPRKELFETWEAALVITEAFGDSLKGAGPAGDGEDRSATRVADLAGGHGFLALALLVLNPTLASAVVVDRRKPDSHERLVSSLAKAFPKLRLHARARFVEASVADADVKNATRVVFASVHACGDLSDAILALAVEARAPVALVPCCHRGLGSARRLAKRLDDAMLRTRTDGDALAACGEEKKGNVSPSVAVDVARLETLRRAGYAVSAATLPREITPQNRVILGACASRCKAREDDENDDSGTENQDNASPGWRSVAERLPPSPWRRFGAARRRER